MLKKLLLSFVPMIPTEPVYSDDLVTLYCGNAYDLIGSFGHVDFLLTDPPYKITASGGGMGAKRQYLSDIDGKIDDGFDMGILDRFDNWCVFCSKAQLIELLLIASKKTWSLVTWNKPNPTPLTNSNYLPDTEYIVHAYNAGRLFGDYKDKARFIVHPVEKNNFGHPTVKPLAVVSKMIRLGTVVGDAILDPFCGTGTTLVAARLLGRKAIGIEKDEKHCQTAIKRLAQSVFNFD